MNHSREKTDRRHTVQNFSFYNPTRIVFGRDQINHLDDLIPTQAHVLLIYGGTSARRYGTLETVIRALKGRAYSEFGGIEPNPQYETLIKAARQIKEGPIDFILAVGGGSVMDGTKFIALAAAYTGEDPASLLFDATKRSSVNPIPFGFVATLPATGSEMNPTGVISYRRGKFAFASDNCYPRFSILDPQLTMTLPRNQVVNGIVDTYIHVLEQYLTYPVDARFQDRTAEGLLITLREIAQKNLDDPTDYDARANLVWCATMGLNGLIGAGVPQDWSTHMIGHEITALYGLDHACSLAAILPALLSYRIDQKLAKLAQYGRRVFGINDLDDRETALLAIEQTREFFDGMGMGTTLSAFGITADQITAIIEALSAHGMTTMSETGDLRPEDVHTILLRSL